MKSVIIGGGGFIGSHLSAILLADGQEVRIFDRPDARYLEYSHQHGAEVVTGNFQNPIDLHNAISTCDVVYHLVSATVPKTSNDDPCFDVQANVIGTLQLLDEMRKAKVSKIVFASSGGTVYGNSQEIPITENHPTEPISSYGIAKLTIEKYLYLYRTLYGLDYGIARISNAYGERQPITGSQGAISAFLQRVINHGEITIWGDGSVVRDYIHANDIARGLLCISTIREEPRIFNIGSGQGYSLNDIIRIIGDITHQTLQPKYISDRPFDVKTNVLDISRAEFHLNWRPMIALDEGISRTYQWMVKENAR